MWNMEIPKKNVEWFSIPSLGLWTWLIWWAREADYSQDSEWIRWIQDAISLWYTHIDTAEMYGWWHCEEVIWKAIEWYDRWKLFIASKVFKTNLKYDDVLKACENSLKRLKIDFLDLYLIHVANDEIPLEETMKAFNRLKDEGMIKNVWVSNFSVEQIKEAQYFSNSKIVNNQIEYSLITRNTGTYWWIVNMENDIIPYCQKNGIIITAERPIERWLLAKKWFPLLDELVKKYNKTHAQIAMNWLLSKENIITIPKSSNIDRLKENLGSVGWSMEDEDYKRLDLEKFESSDK